MVDVAYNQIQSDIEAIVAAPGGIEESIAWHDADHRIALHQCSNLVIAQVTLPVGLAGMLIKLLHGQSTAITVASNDGAAIELDGLPETFFGEMRSIENQAHPVHLMEQDFPGRRQRTGH